MRQLPRELFLPESLRHAAYGDHALPIGHEQTISQPFMVALMTEKLSLEETHDVLEVGTGSGYQTAILAFIGGAVFTVERLSDLSRRAERILAELGIGNVRFRTADGSRGWPEHAPYDRILVTAGAPATPHSLLDQLSPGGRLVIPTGSRSQQELQIFDKLPDGRIRVTESIRCAFVPLIGEEGWEDDLP
jgi:protein-L-isoaspartate(D-aspartate) O-methyltransferase